MNILIKNLSNTYNYGSMMMGENLISYLNQFFTTQVNYYIETSDETNIERLRIATRYDNIYKNEIVYQNTKSNNRIIRRIERYLNTSKLYRDYKKKYDYIIILGGDDYSEEYYDLKTERKYIVQVLKNLIRMNKHVPVYMIGQTIGPYTGKRKKVAKKVFNKLKLYTRDEKNYNYLKEELNCESIKMHHLAYLDLTLENSINNDLLKKYGLKPNDYIVFVGTGLIHHYSRNTKEAIRKFYKIINMIINENKGKKIVWLSHVTGKDASDNKMLDELFKIDNELSSKITIIKEELIPAEARFILGNAYYNLSCRMHAAVSSLQMGRPCICFSYSPKYAGVVGKEFNLNELVIESKNDDYYNNDNDELEKKTLKAMNYIKDNYDKLQETINRRLLTIKEDNLKIIREIAKEMEK